jgi:hypothetical protein
MLGNEALCIVIDDDLQGCFTVRCYIENRRMPLSLRRLSREAPEALAARFMLLL